MVLVSLKVESGMFFFLVKQELKYAIDPAKTDNL